MYRICIQWYNFFVMDLHDHSLRLSKKQIELCETLGLDDTDAVLSYYPIRYDSFQETPFTSWAIKEHVTFEARGTVVKDYDLQPALGIQPCFGTGIDHSGHLYGKRQGNCDEL